RHQHIDDNDYSLLRREVDDEVEAERTVRDLAHAPDLLAEERRREELRLEDPESSGSRDRPHEIGTGQVGPHRRADDGNLDPEEIADPRAEHSVLRRRDAR